jgi:hypothetical protein
MAFLLKAGSVFLEDIQPIKQIQNKEDNGYNDYYFRHLDGIHAHYPLAVTNQPGPFLSES